MFFTIDCQSGAGFDSCGMRSFRGNTTGLSFRAGGSLLSGLCVFYRVLVDAFTVISPRWCLPESAVLVPA